MDVCRIPQISTHAPRTGSDDNQRRAARGREYISTHAPRTGSDTYDLSYYVLHQISTHAPRTGSDGSQNDRTAQHQHISTHAPRTGSDSPPVLASQPLRISTHAPRTGSDENPEWLEDGLMISTHAPRTGSDGQFPLNVFPLHNFNPRSPHGERRTRRRSQMERKNHFNPRSPHGERHRSRCDTCVAIAISTHAPRTGSDNTCLRLSSVNGISTHAPRTGSDVFAQDVEFLDSAFQPTLPARGATAKSLSYRP